MRELIYIHGAGATPEDPPWSRLAQALGDGWKVIAPSLGEPDPETWVAGIDAALAGAAGDVVLVGHSLGFSMLVQTIATRRPGRKAAGLVGMSAPFWERADMPDYLLPDDFPAALSGNGRIVLFHSRDDEEISVDHLAKWGRRLPQAELHELRGLDHVMARGDVGPVLRAIQSL